MGIHLVHVMGVVMIIPVLVVARQVMGIKLVLVIQPHTIPLVIVML